MNAGLFYVPQALRPVGSRSSDVKPGTAPAARLARLVGDGVTCVKD